LPREVDQVERQTGAPASSDALIPQLQRIHDRIAAARQDVVQIVTVLTDEQARKRPDPESWSVADCLDHMCVTGRKILPRIAAGIERAREKGWYGSGPFRYSWWGDWFVRESGPQDFTSRRTYKTPKLYRPAREWPLEEIVRSFTHLQDDLLRRVRDANGIDLARVKIASPAAWWLRLSLGQWLELIAGHQERHLLQARNVRRAVQSAANTER
jgi:hypothetical protein